VQNKRLYEVRVIVNEEKIYHIYADDEADLTSIWNKDNFAKEKPIDTLTISKDRKNYRMIKNKENL
tara:strand:+ start:545 stop:742 length:198 start_codon:yes stop_codon:yes gene_type:complete